MGKGKGKTPGGMALEFSQGFMEPLSQAITAYANIAVAQANANAQIAVSQQKTAQQALEVNAPILHELDRPFLTLKGKTGGKKSPEFELNLSVMDAYALGDLWERGMMDLSLMDDGLDPSSFSYGWDEVRTPRTQISGKPTGVVNEKTVKSKPPADTRNDWQKFWDWFNSDWITF